MSWNRCVLTFKLNDYEECLLKVTMSLFVFRPVQYGTSLSCPALFPAGASPHQLRHQLANVTWHRSTLIASFDAVRGNETNASRSLSAAAATVGHPQLMMMPMSLVRFPSLCPRRRRHDSNFYDNLTRISDLSPCRRTDHVTLLAVVHAPTLRDVITTTGVCSK